MWTLIFYVSAGFGNASTGGPALIERFKSQTECVAAGQSIKIELDTKLDWFKCVLTNKAEK